MAAGYLTLGTIAITALFGMASAGQSHYCPSTYTVRELQYISYPIYCWNCYRTVRWICRWGRQCTWVTVTKINPYTCCLGWRGRRCDIPICNSPGPCLNGGLCVGYNKCECLRGKEGPTCRLPSCSYQTDCYPGQCQQGGGQTTCDCAGLFEGENCRQLKAGVNFRDCTAYLQVKQDVIGSAVCSDEALNITHWAGKRDFDNVRVQWLASYDRVTDLPERPSYLVDFLHGMDRTWASMTLRDTNGVQLGSLQTKYCYRAGTNEDPSESKVCEANFDFPQGVTTQQTLELRVYGRTGGFKVVRDENNLQRTIRHEITGITTNDLVEFVFDFVPPFHCSQSGECDASEVNPINHGPDILPTANFSVNFPGWNDSDSGLQTVYVDVYHLSWHAEGYMLEDLNPIIQGQYDLFAANLTLHYDLPEPGLYSIIARVLDWANNTAYARALLLYDDVSKVETTASPIVVRGANRVGETDFWITDSAVPINISWANRYVNKFQVDNHLLDPVRPFSRTFPDGIDDVIGNRTLDAYPSLRGIAKYSYATTSGLELSTRRRKRAAPPPGSWETIYPLAESVEISETMSSGDSVTLWISASDATGRDLVEYINIRVDTSAPSVDQTLTTFTENTGYGDLRYYSRLNVHTVDVQGGIHTIEYTIFDVTSVQNPDPIKHAIHQGQRSSKTADQCNLDGSCFCTTNFGECYTKPQEVYINNCWLRNSPDRLLRVEGTIYNRARLSVDFSFQLLEVPELLGMDQFPAPDDVRISDNWGFGVRFSWAYNESCYEMKAVNFNVEGVSTNYNSLQRVVTMNTTEVIVEGLLPTHEYKLTTWIEYDNSENGQFINKGEQVVLYFRTHDGPEPGLGAGAIVGIVIGCLLFIAILLIVILILIRIRAKKHPIPTRVRTTALGLRATIVDRFSRHPASRDDLDWESGKLQAENSRYAKGPSVHYVSRPVLTGDEDDIYFYSSMETDPNASWKHSSDRFTLGKVIASGKFADLYLGILEEKGQRQTVVAKTLKSRHSPDDALLMKAKMNFLAHGVEAHPNLVNFMGAVVSRKTLLLEHCDTSLKDWLKHLGNPTGDDEDNMINFCTDIARGMEHLHSQEIIHRRLGARNVMLRTINGRTLAKLFGFGPMKGEEEGSDGVNSAKERVPIKWMAPEQLGLGKRQARPYDTKTDVWSYGITVWEIFSKGANPYSDKRSSEIKELLETGYRLTRPVGCPEPMFVDIVDNCWVMDPNARPDFEKIRTSLEKHFHGMELGDEYYSDEALPRVSYVIRNNKNAESQFLYSSTN